MSSTLRRWRPGPGGTPRPRPSSSRAQFTLYTHAGSACGKSTISLPLGFGTVELDGLACPLAAGAAADFGLSVDLPTNAPAGSYVITASGEDENGKSLFCADLDLTIA